VLVLILWAPVFTSGCTKRLPARRPANGPPSSKGPIRAQPWGWCSAYNWFTIEAPAAGVGVRQASRRSSRAGAKKSLNARPSCHSCTRRPKPRRPRPPRQLPSRRRSRWSSRLCRCRRIRSSQIRRSPLLLPTAPPIRSLPLSSWFRPIRARRPTPLRRQNRSRRQRLSRHRCRSNHPPTSHHRSPSRHPRLQSSRQTQVPLRSLHRRPIRSFRRSG
jgi:hypothetical protein